MQHNTEKKPGNPRRIIKGVLYVVMVLLLIPLLLTALLFIYEDEVKAAIIKELNKNLKAEVRINPENIDLTILKTFPDCSLEFKNLLMMEALPVKNRDTLLFAGRVGLNFNVLDLWNKKYQIRTIHISDGLVRAVIMPDGKNNYTFWNTKNSAGSQANDSIRFDLKKVEADNIRLSYKNKQQKIKTELEIKQLVFKGSFSDLNYELETNAHLRIRNIVNQKVTFLKNKDFDFELTLNVNNDRYTFQKTALRLNKLALKLEGGFVYRDSLESVELKYTAPDLDIASAISLLPETFKEKVNDYESGGDFYAEGTLNYRADEGFSAETKFGIKNGSVTYKPKSTEAKNLNLDGHLRYSPSVSILELSNVSANLNGDDLSGQFVLRDFSNPYIRLNAKANLNLINLQNFWPIDSLTRLEGNLVLDAGVDGLLRDLKSRTFSEKVKLELNAGLSALHVQFKGDDKLYAIENCSLSAHDRHIEVHDLILKRGNSDVKVNGKMPGVFNYLADRTQPLVIVGSLRSENLQLEDFMNSSASGSGASARTSLIPSGVDFKLSAAINKFSYAKFSAEFITGEIEIKNQKAMASDVKFSAIEGEAMLDAYADNSQGRLDVVLSSQFRDININKLFSDFNNFGQNTLTDQNLKGFATATVEMKGTWSNELVPDYNSLKVYSDLSVDQGELMDFQPLYSLSDYLKKKDLEHIRFSKLDCRVEIKDQKISLPQTTIKNSALNIQLAGTHSFDNVLDYHMRVLNQELKAKRREGKEDEFEAREFDKDNKRTLFIWMHGDIDHLKVEPDVKDMMKKIKDDIREEKEIRKQIPRQILEDLGLRQKDTTSVKRKKPEKAFELEKPGQNKQKTTEGDEQDNDEGDF